MDSSKRIQNIAHDDEQQKILSRTAEKNNDLQLRSYCLRGLQP